MPRRPTYLRPDDGPVARFALELRALRDEAGFDAPTVDSIAAKHHIPRSTLYAALRGRRVPTRPILAALVNSWGGDPAEWLSKRASVEAELEAMRPSAARRVQSSSATKPASRPAVTSTSQQDVPRTSAEEALANFAQALRDLRLNAGQPSLRQIASRGRYSNNWVSPSTLSEMLRGKRVPSWASTMALVEALEGDIGEWRNRWTELRKSVV